MLQPLEGTGKKHVADYIDVQALFETDWFKRLESQPRYSNLNLRNVFESSSFLLLDEPKEDVVAAFNDNDHQLRINAAKLTKLNEQQMIRCFLHELVHKADFSSKEKKKYRDFLEQWPHGAKVNVFDCYFNNPTEINAYSADAIWLQQDMTAEEAKKALYNEHRIKMPRKRPGDDFIMRMLYESEVDDYNKKVKEWVEMIFARADGNEG